MGGFLGVGLSLTSLLLMGSAPVLPPVVAPVSSISTDGWTATSGAPDDAVGKFITVNRAGFDGSGNPTTLTETLTFPARLRQAYPNQTLKTADKMVLSDFIYATDAVVGATNLSTRPAPKPIAMWLIRDKLIHKEATFTARLAVAHAHARGGRPVAAVRFRATDGTTTVEALVNTMEVLTFSVTGLSAPHFAAVLDFSGFPNGATITIDAVIYPWVGNAFTISTDADAYPSPNLTTLRVLNDRTGAFGTAYAYVDATLGTAGGSVSATPATAAAAPFQTVVQAATAIRAFNNVTYGRNFTDGGVIRLVEGTHVLASKIRTPAPTNVWPLTIEAADPAKRSTTVFTEPGATMIGSMPNHIVVKDLTLRRASSESYVFIDNGAGSQVYTNLMSIERCVFDAAGYSPYAGWLYTTGCGFFIDCDQIADCGQGGVLGVVNKTCHSIGSRGNFMAGAACFGAVGCNGSAGVGVPASTTGKVASRGPLFGWNHFVTPGDGGRLINVTAAVDDAGIAVVGSVIEQVGGDTGPAVFFAADGHNATVYNAVFQCCTVVGSRTNWLYQDNGSTRYDKVGYMRFVVNEYRNTKTDVFVPNANLTGNWPAVFNVSAMANCARKGENSGSSTVHVGSWLGEVMAPGDAYGSNASPVAANWANDQSWYGGRSGNGDYTPGPGNALPMIPEGLAPYPYDLKGRPISNTGTARSGAIQMAA